MAGEANTGDPLEYVRFTKTGLCNDATNAWGTVVGYAQLGDFELMAKIRTYEEYFKMVATRYNEAGDTDIFGAIMERSNPKAVEAFNKLVREFNGDLERIVKEEDSARVEKFSRDMRELNQKLPDEPSNPSPTAL